MTETYPLWRRFWASVPLSYKLVLVGLVAIMTATIGVMAATYRSAGDSLMLQLERQVSRDLNVCENQYRTRLEEMQLTAVGLARHAELVAAVAEGRRAPAAALLEGEIDRLKFNLAVLVDRQGRLVGAGGRGPVFDPQGTVSASLKRGEQVVSTERWTQADAAALAPASRHRGLVRQVVTPLGPAGRPMGALVLAEWVAGDSPVPSQVASLIGGGVGLLDTERVVAQSGLPLEGRLGFNAAIWRDVRAGRYFFTEEELDGGRYLYMFRPITNHLGQPVGAMVRGFPESHIAETLHRYAGGIAVITTAAICFSLVAFLVLTRRLLFPLRRLARISLSLAGESEGPTALSGADEMKRLEQGVGRLAERLTQSREELAETAVKLEVEARQLAVLNQEKARLLEAIRDHDRLRGQLIEKIITAQEAERKRIARELHDETGQSLTSLLVGLKFVEGAKTLEDAKERVAALKQLTVQTLEEVHKLSVDLRPAMLDDLGLVVTLRSMVKDFGLQHGLEAVFEADNLEVRLPPQWEVTLYRVVQEALTNAGKYAHAGRVAVSLRLDQQRLTVTVVDDGLGFDPKAISRERREHLGLAGMQERMALIGGEFELDSAPGHGTRLTVRATLDDPAMPPMTKGTSSYA